MIGWCHQLNGHEFEQDLGVDDGQGSLACCSPWGHKELDTTEQLNCHFFYYYKKIHIKFTILTIFVLCHPFLLLPSAFPCIRIFSNESVFRIKWPKYWSFSFSISPSSEYSRLISFWIDWFDLLAVQGTLKRVV